MKYQEHHVVKLKRINYTSCGDCKIGESYLVLKTRDDLLTLFTHYDYPLENNKCEFSIEEVDLLTDIFR